MNKFVIDVNSIHTIELINIETDERMLIDLTSMKLKNYRLIVKGEPDDDESL